MQDDTAANHIHFGAQDLSDFKAVLWRESRMTRSLATLLSPAEGLQPLSAVWADLRLDIHTGEERFMSLLHEFFC